MSWSCSREQAMDILGRHVKAGHLVRHALMVEAVMRYFAQLYGEDAEKWGVIGLLHDIDFEEYPERHCQMVRELLCPYGFPEEYLHAIESHGYGLVSSVEPLERMEKVLFATDELTGLIAATALMRPSRSILDLELSSVKKKWKQKGFAAGVNREVVQRGAQMLGIELDELISHTIRGMQTAAEETGLKGELPA